MVVIVIVLVVLDAPDVRDVQDLAAEHAVVVLVVAAIHVQDAAETVLGFVTILAKVDVQIVAMPLAVITVQEQTHNGIYN